MLLLDVREKAQKIIQASSSWKLWPSDDERIPKVGKLLTVVVVVVVDDDADDWWFGGGEMR